MQHGSLLSLAREGLGMRVACWAALRTIKQQQLLISTSEVHYRATRSPQARANQRMCATVTP